MGGHWLPISTAFFSAEALLREPIKLRRALLALAGLPRFPLAQSC